MTIIAWDGIQLAADKRATIGTLIRTTTKIFRVDDNTLAAYAGEASAGEELLAWFQDGHNPTAFPASQRDKDSYTSLLIVNRDGTLHKYESTPYPSKFPPQQFAMGSGRDFAMAAMHCGKTSSQAVLITSEFDNGCGNGVDTLTFDN